MRIAMISSTSRDLPDQRLEVMKACQRKDFFPRWMEVLPAGKSPMEASLGLLEGADVYIGSFALGYPVPARWACHLCERGAGTTRTTSIREPGKAAG